MIKRLLTITALVLLLSPLAGAEEFMDTFKTRGRSIYLLHAVPESAEKRAPTITDLGERDQRQINLLAAIPGESDLLPLRDIETMVSRIDRLTEEFEASKDGERQQSLRFEIAYEYFLLYLHFQKIKYGFQEEKRSPDQEIPITDGELRQYLMLSRHYISPFLERAQKNPGARPSLRDMDDVTFRLREDEGTYLNVHFLAMMIEEERMAGNWIGLGAPPSISQVCERKTWHWLETLWKRYHRKMRGVAYTPDSKRLFSLYELFLRYHFMGRNLRYNTKADPLTDTRTRTLLSRLSALKRAAGISTGTPYARYVEEAKWDSGNTSFIVSLYLGRRGFSVMQNNTLPATRAQLFELFQGYYDLAARQIRYNISYRKQIYNELILLGLETGNLRLMEDVLFQYGHMSLRIPGSEEAPHYIGDSSRLTMACLIANILEKKRVSGLAADSGKYAEMASSLVESLTTAETSYWRYASVIHRCLAEYYSGSHEGRSEAQAIYHSRQAFLTLCKKLSLSGQAGDFTAFQKMPQAESFLSLFLYYQKKYPTSPHASTPREYHAARIIEMKLQKNRS